MDRRSMSLRVLAIVAIGATGIVGAPFVGTSDAAVVTPELRWERAIPRVAESSPTIADVDGDGLLDASFGTRDGTLWVVGPDGNPRPGWPQQTGDPIDSSPAVGDTDGDGRPELFVGTGTYERSGGSLVSYRADGARRFAFNARDKVFARPSIHSSPAIGDVGGSPTADVSFGSLGLESVWSLEQDGVRHQGFPFYADDTIFSSPALVDVDGDGRRDIVIGGDSTPGPPVDHKGGMLRAIRGNGTLIWEFRINDILRSSPAVGDINGDGQLDIVFGAGNNTGGADSIKVFAVDLRGRLLPGWPQTTDGVTNAAPTLADFDGNGVLDVAIGTWDSRHGLGKGGSVWAFDGAGRRLRGYPRASGGGVVLGSISTVDLDGDGHQDLLVPTGAGIFAYGGDDGAPRFSLAVGQVTFHNQPAVADVDGNGRLDIIAAGSRPSGAGALLRWELPAISKLGARGWHQFRKDARHTGAWSPPVPPSRAMPLDRISGPDRAATAAAVATSGITRAGTVIVATSGGYADALAAGPAAAADDGVVLLSHRDQLPAPTRDAIRSLAPDTILVVGGTEVVSDAVLAEIRAVATSASVRRISGNDRYETAAALSAESFTAPPAVAYVATGESYADALAGGAAAAHESAPVLLVRRDEVPGSTLTELRRLRPQRLVVLGGAAAVSEATFQQLRAEVANTQRRSGGDRWGTAAAISAAVFPSAASPMVATGAGFADALAAAPVAARRSVPLLLVAGPCVPDATRAEIERLGATRLTAVGGFSAVWPTVGALTRCE